MSRWVVSYVIYLRMSFIESLGGFLSYILTLSFIESLGGFLCYIHTYILY